MMSLQESMNACIVYEAYKEEECTVSQNKSIAPSKIDILMDTFWTTDISLLDVAH